MHRQVQILLFASLTTALGCAGSTTAATPSGVSTSRAAHDQSGSQQDSTVASSTVSAKELDAATLMSIAQQHYTELRSCYETRLKESPELQGMVEVELTIDSKGHIREGRITNDTIGDPELQFCIAQRILGWKFPPHADESLTVQFPFEFAPVLVDEPIKEGS